MASQPTEKSRYPSRYSPKAWITASQYIVELICEAKALADQTSLPKQFWTLPKWKTYFAQQSVACSTLLKKYDARAIILALQDSRAKRIFSLRAPHLAKIIDEKVIQVGRQDEMERVADMKREASPTSGESSVNSSVPHKSFVGGKKSLKSKLGDL